MKSIYIYLIITTLITLSNSYYLSNQNNKILLKLIKSPDLKIEDRNIVNMVLFKSYHKWAIKQAIDFKKKHYYKCKQISLDELILYSRFGLYRATLNYTGETHFTFYASFYVNSQLKKALTDCFSLSILPKSIRMKNKYNFTSNQIHDYNNKLFTKTSNNLDYQNKVQYQYNTLIDKYDYQNKLKYIWDFVNTLDPFLKRIIYLKYDYQFKTLRNNKLVSILMCCSEEWIRINLIKFKNLLNNKINFIL